MQTFKLHDQALLIQDLLLHINWPYVVLSEKMLGVCIEDAGQKHIISEISANPHELLEV